MLDIKLIRESRDLVKENIKKKFQDVKLPLVDEVYLLDIQYREYKTEADNLRSEKNKLSESIGALMRDKNIDEANKVKEQVSTYGNRILDLEAKEVELEAKIKEIMMTIPNIIASDVPIGRNDTENVVREVFGEPFIPDYEIPYHAEIMENFNADRESFGI